MNRGLQRAALGSLLLIAGAASLRAQAPSSQRSAGQKTQKLANPLNDLLEEARAAIDRQDFAAAIEPLRKFLAEKPDFAYAHFQLAYAFTGFKRLEEAKSEYQHAVALDPKLVEGWLNLGLLLLESDPAAAADALRHAAELQPAQSRPRFLLGYARERSGDLAGAVEAYEGASKLDPRDYEVAFAYGRTLLRLKRPADAEARFRSALVIKPDSAPARLGLASSLAAQDKAGAAAAIKSYLELKPGDRAARFDLARLLYSQREFAAALAEIDAAEAGQQPSPDTIRLRADVLIAQARWDDAVGVLQHALTFGPRDSGLHASLGHVYLEKHDFPSAERELKMALGLDQQSAGALRDLSDAYYLADNCPAALGALDQLARSEPPNSGTWFMRATCYDKLGNMAEAIEAYQKFIELDHGRDDAQDFQARQRVAFLRRKLEGKKR